MSQHRWQHIAGRSTVPGAVWRADYPPNYSPRVGDPRLPSSWADYDAQGRRVGQGEAWSNTPAADELALWDAEAPTIAARAQSLNLPLDALYIRWGRLPRGGRSTNHATGEREAGVSCYSAEYEPVSGSIRYDEDGTLCGALISYLITYDPARPTSWPYLITGRHAGRGADDEPLLADVRVVAVLRPMDRGFEIVQG